jgi:DNA-binding MarR family transcriptional regulator
MSYEQLKIDNQLCFPVYAASRLIIREYQPYLDKLGITYPQYLVLMVLWELGSLPVNDIAKKLILNTNTITPLLKRMEQQDIVERTRSQEDERKVIISLTAKGKALKEEASLIPQALIQRMLEEEVQIEELIQLKKQLEAVIMLLSK